MANVDLTELFGAIDTYIDRKYGPKIRMRRDGPETAPTRQSPVSVIMVPADPKPPTGTLSDEAQLGDRGRLTPGAERSDGTIDWSLVR